jgi:hypothetical protein
MSPSSPRIPDTLAILLGTTYRLTPPLRYQRDCSFSFSESWKPQHFRDMTQVHFASGTFTILSPWSVVTVTSLSLLRLPFPPSLALWSFNVPLKLLRGNASLVHA